MLYLCEQLFQQELFFNFLLKHLNYYHPCTHTILDQQEMISYLCQVIIQSNLGEN